MRYRSPLPFSTYAPASRMSSHISSGRDARWVDSTDGLTAIVAMDTSPGKVPLSTVGAVRTPFRTADFQLRLTVCATSRHTPSHCRGWRRLPPPMPGTYLLLTMEGDSTPTVVGSQTPTKTLPLSPRRSGRGTAKASRHRVPHSSRQYRDGWGRFSFPSIPGPLGFDLDSALLACEAMAEAAPAPVLGLVDKTSLDGVAVDVAQLLHEFFVS